MTVLNPPAQINRPQLEDTARGLFSETYPMNATLGAGTTLATQQIIASLIGLAAGDIVTNMVVNVTTAAAGVAPTLIKLAIVRKDGLVLGTTANVAADAKWTALGFQSFPLTAPLPITVSDGYYAAILQNGAFTVTPLQIYRAGSNLATGSLQLGTGARIFASGGVGQTDITGTLTLADPGSGLSLWFGVT